MKQNRDMVIDVAVDMREDSFEGHGLPLRNYDPEDLREIVSDCVGFRIDDVDLALARVAFEEGKDIAKRSIWY